MQPLKWNAEEKKSSNRRMDYLRISVTDRCNMRCIYCMPKEGIVHKPYSEILTFEEVLRLAKIFASLKIRKIRITGGEPLLRRGLIYLIQSLVRIEGIEEVSLTTNGIFLPFYAESLKKFGVGRINISLDTLDKAKFEMISGCKMHQQVFKGIQKAKKVGFNPIKLNTVIMRGINDNEITDFVKFAISQGLVLRFIELMKITPLWNESRYLSLEEIKNVCKKHFNLKKINKVDSTPAEYYEVDKDSLLGFIKTNKDNCKNCNRLRLTASGEFKICLYENAGLSLRQFLKDGSSDNEIRELIATKMGMKENANYGNYESTRHYMCNIGG